VAEKCGKLSSKKACLVDSMSKEGEYSGNPLANLGYLLRQPKVWGLTLGFMAYGYSFYLFLSWLPGYLETALHMSVLKSGIYTIVPWIVATLTDIFIGGWLVDFLIKRGNEPTRVRKTLFTIGMLLGIAVIGAAFTANPNIAILWISIALGGLAFAAPIGWSIPALIAPTGNVGAVGSIMNFFVSFSVVSLLPGASSRSLSQTLAVRAAFPVPQSAPAPGVMLPAPGSVLPEPGAGLLALLDFLLGGARFLPAGS
jgi:sugar phosphate permease